MKDEGIKHGLINDPYQSAVKDFQTVISVLYILAVAIGMLFSYKKYIPFGVNIFDYADIFDFLIAPFSDPIILFFTLISFLLVYSLYLIDLWWRKRYPVMYSKMSFGLDKKSWYSVIRYLSFLSVLLLYLYSSAEYYGLLTNKKIKAQTTINLRFSDNETINGIMIGKTKEIIFFLNNGKVTAVPITSLVKEFEIK